MEKEIIKTHNLPTLACWKIGLYSGIVSIALKKSYFVNTSELKGLKKLN